MVNSTTRWTVDAAKYASLLQRFHQSGPYYTSYPALGKWSDQFKHEQYLDGLRAFFNGEGKNEPLHLYVHIPFCAKLCWYCICNMTVSHDYERIQKFLNYLYREIDMLAAFFEQLGVAPNFAEIHLGGGTPSHLKNEQFAELCKNLGKLTSLKNLREFAMEIDPRTCSRENLHFYADHGVRRISFGVQDFDANVQAAINRVQPYEMIRDLLSEDVRARFTGFNFDLLYGLPRQTKETFRRTLELVRTLSPERVSLLRFAYVPEVRKHMGAIKAAELPPAEDLPLMFTESVQTLLDQDYEWVGLDYFAKASDDLGKAVQEKTVWRTFNGFAPGRTHHMLGLGPTSTGGFGPYYSQNLFEFKEYFESIDQGKFPIVRGYELNKDDIIRRDVVFQLLCHQQLDFNQISARYEIDHKTYFANELAALAEEFSEHDIVEIVGPKVSITPFGRFFMRNICMLFDTFYKGENYSIPAPVLKGRRSLL